MTKKEKQHYIPQFYLRYFASNEKRTHINVFRLNEKKCNYSKIENQCKGRRIYGSDQDEEDITVLDDKHGFLLHKIISNGIETISKHDYSEFIVFTGLTYARSKRIALLFENGLNPFHYEELHQKLEKPYRGGVLFGNSIPFYWLNLRLLFLINNTDIDFITSDSPVVLFNKYYQNESSGDHFKFDSNGLQVFFPISSKRCAVFFDDRFYNPYSMKGIRTHKIENIDTFIYDIQNRFHIKQINNLQYYNTIDILLYSNNKMTKSIISNIDEVKANNLEKVDIKLFLQNELKLISLLLANYIPFKMNSPYLKTRNR